MHAELVKAAQGTARQYLRDDAAQDVAQDALLKCLGRLDPNRTTAEHVGYVRAATRSVALSYLRGRSRRVTRESSLDASTLDDGDFSAADDARFADETFAPDVGLRARECASEIERALEDAFACLTDGERRAFSTTGNGTSTRAVLIGRARAKVLAAMRDAGQGDLFNAHRANVALAERFGNA
jgi:DNA-directed RNA polymerase specialized sigma24 family protein